MLTVTTIEQSVVGIKPVHPEKIVWIYRGSGMESKVINVHMLST